MKRKLALISEFFLMLIVLSACESRFYESSPVVVKKDAFSIDERLKQKSEIDTSLEQIQRGILNVKKIFELVKKIKNSSDIEDFYTPLDFLIEINNDLKSKFPEKDGENLVRHSSTVIPIEGISEQCKKVETRLETKKSGDLNTINNELFNLQIIYLIKSCYSLGQYLPLFTVELKSNSTEFRFNNDTLASIFKMILKDDSINNSNCKLVMNKETKIESINCTSLIYVLNKTEYLLAKSIMFNVKGEIQIALVSDIYENKVKKASLNFKKMTNEKLIEL